MTLTSVWTKQPQCIYKKNQNIVWFLGLLKTWTIVCIFFLMVTIVCNLWKIHIRAHAVTGTVYKFFPYLCKLLTYNLVSSEGHTSSDGILLRVFFRCHLSCWHCVCLYLGDFAVFDYTI